MAAFSQKAELNQARFSVLFCSEFGQLRSFEQTNKRSECASFVKIIASIEDPVVIRKILGHLRSHEAVMLSLTSQPSASRRLAELS
jgi:prephenate dehydratase